jgi:hypothetical protein
MGKLPLVEGFGKSAPRSGFPETTDNIVFVMCLVINHADVSARRRDAIEDLLFLVPTRQRGNPVWAHLPRLLDAGASELGSHAGAWEPDKTGSSKKKFVVGDLSPLSR